MTKKILLKYLFMYLSFILGLILYSVGVMNIFSTLLVFVGGYISIKNTFDYRLVKRNINNNDNSKINIDNNYDLKNEECLKVKDKVKIKPKNVGNCVSMRYKRRCSRVRRKY